MERILALVSICAVCLMGCVSRNAGNLNQTTPDVKQQATTVTVYGVLYVNGVRVSAAAQRQKGVHANQGKTVQPEVSPLSRVQDLAPAVALPGGSAIGASGGHDMATLSKPAMIKESE